MKAFPGIVEDLFSEGLVYVILVSVLIVSFDSDTFVINLKAIVGPKRVIECKRTFLTGLLIV